VSSVDYDLNRMYEQDEVNDIKYESFKENAIAEFEDCLNNSGDLHELIEKIQGKYWDIFLNYISNSDMNMFILEAALNVKRIEN